MTLMLRPERVGESPPTPARPLVAIVIVNYKTPELTIDCCRSLRRLNYPNFEIIVVDNASGDGSAEMFRDKLDDCHVVVAEENGGYTAGNNLGIRIALDRGADYVHVLNPDTVVLNPDYLAALVNHLEAHPEVGAVGPRVYLRSPDNVQNTVLRFPWLWRRAADWCRSRFTTIGRRSGSHVVDAEVLNGVCVLFRRSTLEEVGLFDERTFAYIEDVEWAYRAHQLDWKRQYVPVDSILHLQKPTGYERGGNVDFLLKRNTLYFLLRTRHWLQAAGYTASTLLMAFAFSLTQRRRRGDGAGMRRWTRRLLRSYVALWRGRWEGGMGRPEF